jgi:hypothetical protein
MQQQGGTHTHGNTFDGGDEGFREFGKALDEAEHGCAVVHRRRRQEIGKIIARGKAAAAAGNQDHAHGRILLGRSQGVRHGAVHGGRQRVLLLRSGHCDMADAVAKRDIDGVAHFFALAM